MTTLGCIEGVGRTLYRDEVENVSLYPLDEKIGLQEIHGSYSRYTGNFSHLAANFYARMPERDCVDLLYKTLGIDIKLDSLADIGTAVAQPLIQKQQETVTDDEIQPPVVQGPNIIEQRHQEIENSPDRDRIIRKALEGEIDGSQRKSISSDLSVSYVEADGIGVSGLPGEVSEKGKNGGPAQTFEVKIGATFTQSFDSNGRPLLDHKKEIYRDSHSTKYMGTVEHVESFTSQLDTFTRNAKISFAVALVFLSDGAIWLENLRLKLFPNSIGIVDIFHALEHLFALVKDLRFNRPKKRLAFYEQCAYLLKLGEIDSMVALISTKITPSNKKKIEKQLAYFTNNKNKMRYGLFRAAGLFIGSGVIEGGCKLIVENRLNRSGMRWTKKNAANVVALRSAIYSGSFDSPADSLAA